MSDTPPKTLFSYMLEEEKAHLCELRARRAAAEDELNHIRRALENAEQDLSSARRAQATAESERETTAVSEYLREAPPEPQTAPVGPLRMERHRQVVEGLRKRREEAQAVVQHADDEYRRATLEVLLGPCFQRASEDYLKRAEGLVESWTVMDSAEQLSGHTRPVLGTGFWGTLRIPGTDAKSLPVLRQATQMTVNGPLVFDAFDARIQGLTNNALHRLTVQVRTEIGEWPLDRRL